MITYAVWDYICDFNYWGNAEFRRMASYGFCCFLSLITILLDIIASPFEIMGIIINFITRRKK